MIQYAIRGRLEHFNSREQERKDPGGSLIGLIVDGYFIKILKLLENDHLVSNSDVQILW